MAERLAALTGKPNAWPTGPFPESELACLGPTATVAAYRTPPAAS